MAFLTSQPDPLPANLPFQITSGTIGRGAYASIKKAAERDKTNAVFAVKFIHKPSALKNGRTTLKQIGFEVSLHQHCNGHANIIGYLGSDEDRIWRWIAMEFAEGGDLFDKIEADVGVDEDIAHFYFRQLIAGVSWMHGRGVAHRDIKPENMLLDRDGNLKIADFGLASLYSLRGKIKLSSTLCGSPPYVAPEVGRVEYRGDFVDIWSCGVLLFVLLVGNTPWDEPTNNSYEFCEYVEHNGKLDTDLWANVPTAVRSLLRGMMKINPEERFTIEDIRRHPWFTRPNPYLAADGLCTNSLSLATTLLERLHVSFGVEPLSSQMDVDISFSSTQPDPVTPSIYQPRSSIPSSQPSLGSHVFEFLCDEPSMSQFCSSNNAVSQSLTQNAQRFKDICPQQSLTEFFSAAPYPTILSVLAEGLQHAGVNAPDPEGSEMEGMWFHIRTRDSRKCALEGDILVEDIGRGLRKVRFSRSKGDPVEWRRFFKKVVACCREVVVQL